MTEAASAFARREMLAEARDALQSARAALALRSDVGPAHWCNACLVAMEIAARDGDVPLLEAEAARLRSLSGGRRYWTEQAHARISGCASRIDRARLDHVFAVLAGEAAPAVPRLPCPVDEIATRDAAECLVTRESPAHPLPTETLSSADQREEASTGWPGRHGDTADDLHPTVEALASSAEFASAPLVDAPAAASRRAPGTEPVTLPPLELAAPRRIVPPIQMPSLRGLRSAPVYRQRRPMAPHLRGILPVLTLGFVLCIYRFTASQGGSPALSGPPTPEHEPRPRKAPAALASLRREEGHAIPHDRLMHGQALLAAGDTLGAVAALSAAAQSDSRGTIAWAAAETLARLPGRSAPAADAYLLAFAAGLPTDRTETVARAQELAGRPDRARRVREQAADH